MKKSVRAYIQTGLVLTIAATTWAEKAVAQSYTYTRSITIAHGQVPNTDQSSFPFLFNTTDPLLKTVANGGHVTNANGYDIVFTSDAAGTQKLNHEIEFYNGSTGQFIAWVQIPTLSHTTDTVIYLFYGNSSITTSQQNKAGVWDSNYKLIYHMADNAANANVIDSTSNGYTGAASANTNTKQTAGQIDGALTFNGSSDNVTSTSFRGPADNITIEAWVKPSSVPGGQKIILEGAPAADGYLRLETSGTNHFRTYFGNGGWGSTTGTDSTASVTTSWTHLVAVHDHTANKTYLYVNGALDINASDTIDPTSSPGIIVGAYTGSGYNFPGIIDEVRVSGTVRSGDWIASEYHNQSNPSTFYSLGSESGTSGSTVSATVTATPGGLSVIVDGTNYPAPKTFQWVPGTSHTIAVLSPQTLNPGAQFVFSNWSDAGAQSHSITVPSSAITYTANFTEQYQLTTVASPSAGGSISPASGWNNAGSVVSVSATANAGYQFAGFSGDLSGTTSPQNLTINGPHIVTANFSGAGGSSWYNIAWTNRKSITVSHTQVSGSSSLTNFPMLFSVTDPNLKTVANGGNVGKTDGSDILFTASDGVTKLNHEIELYNGSTGQLTAWVQIPNLSPTADTAIFVYYGNASAANQQNATAVWDSNYKIVMHLNDQSGTIHDSTSNANNGTANSGATYTSGGVAGGAYTFNGSGGLITVPNNPSWAGNSGFTAEVWVKASGFPDYTGFLTVGDWGGLFPYGATRVGLRLSQSRTPRDPAALPRQQSPTIARTTIW